MGNRDREIARMRRQAPGKTYKIPARCRTCASMHKGGIGKFARWCSAHSTDLAVADGHCRNGHDQYRAKSSG